MRTVYVPDTHVCEGLAGPTSTPGWWFPADLVAARPGTVRECSCGRTWVAGEMAGLVPAIWRREDWWERRRRERQQRRATSPGYPFSACTPPELPPPPPYQPDMSLITDRERGLTSDPAPGARS